MKIAFVNHDLGPYGATKSLLDLIDGLSAKGVECYVIIPKKNPYLKDGPIASQLSKRNIPYQAILYHQWTHKIYPRLTGNLKHAVLNFPYNRLYRLFINLLAVNEIKKQLQKWEVDIVYTNTTVTPVGALAALWVKKPHVWHVREFLRLDHGIAFDWGRNLFTKVINHSSAIIMISQAIQNYYQATVSPSKSYTVYNGVASKEDFDAIQKRKQQFSRQKKAEYTFCIVGRIGQKGQAEAIKGLGLLSKMGIHSRLIVAGRGDYQKLNELVNQLNLQNRVKFAGHIDDPYMIYFQSDACLVCSPHEAFGRVTIEAMVAGLPVIGKKNLHSGTAELIQHAQTGLLYEGKEDALAEMMKQLVENPEQGQKLGEKAWRYAKEHYNRENYVNQIHEILNKVCKQ